MSQQVHIQVSGDVAKRKACFKQYKTMLLITMLHSLLMRWCFGVLVGAITVKFTMLMADSVMIDEEEHEG